MNREPIGVIGVGWVGLVTAAGFAELGHEVYARDILQAKVDALGRGEVPIHEPGLDELVARNREKGRLKFTTDAQAGVAHGLFQMIAVGTPPDEDGSADLRHVLAVARTIGEHLDEYKIVMTKSTVPVGTSDKVKATIAAALVARGTSNKLIARDLRISETTVKTHLLHIFTKLGVDDRTAAVTLAMRRGMLRLG